MDVTPFHVIYTILPQKCCDFNCFLKFNRRKGGEPDEDLSHMVYRTPIEFAEKLWHAVVDRVAVMGDDRLVFSLKDGTEITIEL